MLVVFLLFNIINRYLIIVAENFFKCMEGLGFGDIVRNFNRSRESCVLRKRLFEEMIIEVRNKFRIW